MNIKISKQYYSVEECENNPDHIYVFGDNDIEKGMGGQAIIRNCVNSFGIPTKHLPSMIESDDYIDNAFYSDHPYNYANLLEKIIRLHRLNHSRIGTIVFPYDGLGTGLSKMPEKSPQLFVLMSEMLFRLFGVITYKDFGNKYHLGKALDNQAMPNFKSLIK